MSEENKNYNLDGETELPSNTAKEESSYSRLEHFYADDMEDNGDKNKKPKKPKKKQVTVFTTHKLLMPTRMNHR